VIGLKGKRHKCKAEVELEPWNPGTLEPWNLGTLEPWNLGTLEL